MSNQEINAEMLEALLAVKSALECGDLMADPGLIASGEFGKFTQLLNKLTMAIAKATGGVK